MANSEAALEGAALEQVVGMLISLLGKRSIGKAEIPWELIEKDAPDASTERLKRAVEAALAAEEVYWIRRESAEEEK